MQLPYKKLLHRMQAAYVMCYR
uniref:Uncharacterized protein n=1 Tax=Anguilla anguilla TaxID=7936 RepID=A0A0E9TU89_ANGAN